MTALAGATELFDRALAYAGVLVSDVHPGCLGAATPCAGWSLADLLGHLADSFEAYAEAAGGRVRVSPGVAPPDPLAAARGGVAALRRAWSLPGRPGGPVVVGGVALDRTLAVAVGALEVAVHGWDVGQATGRRTPIPDALAAGLLGVARVVVEPARGRGFGPPRPAAPAAPPGARLLAYVGR